MEKNYSRYQIHTQKASNLIPQPPRFKVKVNRLKLAQLLIKELIHYRANMDVVLSRPCVYGVFSGPIGGFAPREQLCVGCLRCTTQYPEVVRIIHNPEIKTLGDSYFTAEYVQTISHEAESGRIPIKGAGYRGKFGGENWDGMWTDMSEIVRPTRDGIHGREFISTQVDLGGKPPYFDPAVPFPKNISMPIPLLFDILPHKNQDHLNTIQILIEAARELKNYVLLPFDDIQKFSLSDHTIIPVIQARHFDALKNYGVHPHFIELDGWDAPLFAKVQRLFPQSIPIVRVAYLTTDLITCYQAGVRVFHLSANYHGRGRDGRFVKELIRETHTSFVKANCREEVSLIGSGGVVVAEHLAKAILCGLDVVALDTPLLVALQGQFNDECSDKDTSHFKLPSDMPIDWGKQRLKNLVGAWRDQLLEILGAMGIREVRRMRGEMGRAMLQESIEKEAFAGISGYDKNAPSY